MKKIFLFFVLTAVCILSCEKEETRVTISGEPVAPALTGINNGFSIMVTEGSLTDNVSFQWNKADYGVATQVTYALQLDSAGRSFEEAMTLGATQNTSFTLSLEELNARLLNDLGVTPNEVSRISFRVVASMNDKFKEVSPLITGTVKTFKVVATGPTTLWVPGSYQDWNPSAAPVIYSVSETEYEGYVYFQAGAGFKFTSSPDWDHINYGDSGTPGLLTIDGAANGLSASQPGYYRFKVNVEALAYEMYRVESFGLVGTATPGSWDNSTPMTYDPATKKWSKTLDLVGGALKFRANNSWDVNYGPADSNSLIGTLIQTDGAINISEAGNYTVTLDFNRTQAPHVYSYSVVKN